MVCEVGKKGNLPISALGLFLDCYYIRHIKGQIRPSFPPEWRHKSPSQDFSKYYQHAKDSILHWKNSFNRWGTWAGCLFLMEVMTKPLPLCGKRFRTSRHLDPVSKQTKNKQTITRKKALFVVFKWKNRESMKYVNIMLATHLQSQHSRCEEKLEVWGHPQLHGEIRILVYKRSSLKNDVGVWNNGKFCINQNKTVIEINH